MVLDPSKRRRSILLIWTSSPQKIDWPTVQPSEVAGQMIDFWGLSIHFFLAVSLPRLLSFQFPELMTKYAKNVKSSLWGHLCAKWLKSIGLKVL